MKQAGHNVVAVNASRGCQGCSSDPEKQAIRGYGF
jgi:hypothetical protein